MLQLNNLRTTLGARAFNLGLGGVANLGLGGAKAFGELQLQSGARGSYQSGARASCMLPTLPLSS